MLVLVVGRFGPDSQIVAKDSISASTILSSGHMDGDDRNLAGVKDSLAPQCQVGECSANESDFTARRNL